jgi:hypothetical protein
MKLSLVVGLASVAIAATGIAAPSAVAGAECPITACTTLLGPWIQATGVQSNCDGCTGLYSTPNFASVGTDRLWSRSVLACPGGANPLGGTANVSAGPTNVDTGVGPNWSFEIGNLFGASQPALAFGFRGLEMFASFDDAPAPTYSWQEVVGCPTMSSRSTRVTSGVARPTRRPAAASNSSPRTVHRIKITPIKPSRVAVEVQRCHAGEHMESGAVSLAWYTKKPPTPAEMRELSESHWIAGNRLYARVVSGPNAGDNETVKVQLHADCMRR